MKLMDKLGLCWRILREKPSNLTAHADRELVDPDEFDDMQELIHKQLKELVLVFSTHGHSGFSAPYAIAHLEKLLMFEPIGPLLGTENEWVYHNADGLHAQNKRCGRVFKNADGTAYDIDGRVFRDPSGSCYTSKGSRVAVVFPYTPKTEYVDVDKEGNPI